MRSCNNRSRPVSSKFFLSLPLPPGDVEIKRYPKEGVRYKTAPSPLPSLRPHWPPSILRGVQWVKRYPSLPFFLTGELRKRQASPLWMNRENKVTMCTLALHSSLRRFPSSRTVHTPSEIILRSLLCNKITNWTVERRTGASMKKNENNFVLVEIIISKQTVTW